VRGDPDGRRAQRWVLARLRNITCFSLDELNGHIAARVVDLNNRVMKRYGKSRRQLFDELDRSELTALPRLGASFLPGQPTGDPRLGAGRRWLAGRRG
jgi:hypothetical protein